MEQTAEPEQSVKPTTSKETPEEGQADPAPKGQEEADISEEPQAVAESVKPQPDLTPEEPPAAVAPEEQVAVAPEKSNSVTTSEEPQLAVSPEEPQAAVEPEEPQCEMRLPFIRILQREPSTLQTPGEASYQQTGVKMVEVVKLNFIRDKDELTIKLESEQAALVAEVQHLKEKLHTQTALAAEAHIKDETRIKLLQLELIDRETTEKEVLRKVRKLEEALAKEKDSEEQVAVAPEEPPAAEEQEEPQIDVAQKEPQAAVAPEASNTVTACEEPQAAVDRTRDPPLPS
uniref:uncharacterized abhydrolase domain-containing protein DDB_G0269086-like n=1 Tax=Semicossyphus pulcher TaxID=241346 RepID=UPI0037E98974